MNKNSALVLIVVVIAIIGGVLVFTKGSNQSSSQEKMKAAESTKTALQPSKAASQANVKEFTVTGSNFKMDPNEIKVNKGDTVKITFKNADGFHDFVLDEFNVKTARIQGGQEATVQFVADKAGTFEYYCSVGQHRQMGMKGNLIVQ